eukprot:CAMPEP_0170735404 /NCGR_PEP_ID=MMETSP0437-20130122/3079_1 /TAXON_ID=0 /ORGANISM="Sexangularia sp." /LENGTH=160 /DNA_ID=CAMNT_0011073729 /DNA_START=90 /DNA_END=569 /DNA_ORIENTATION=+
MSDLPAAPCLKLFSEGAKMKCARSTLKEPIVAAAVAFITQICTSAQSALDERTNSTTTITTMYQQDVRSALARTGHQHIDAKLPDIADAPPPKKRKRAKLTEAEKAELAAEEERLFREARLALDEANEAPVAAEQPQTDDQESVGTRVDAEQDDDDDDGW